MIIFIVYGTDSILQSRACYLCEQAFFFNIPLNNIVYFVYYNIKHKLMYCTRNTIITHV